MPPLSFGENGDVITTVNLQGEADAREWALLCETRKPFRPEFRAAFVRLLRAMAPEPRRILELGSGPGRLAKEIIEAIEPDEFVLFDFSEPMMSMARDALQSYRCATYVLGSFKEPDWTDALTGPFDAVVAMQSVHEIRHKRHVPGLYAKAAQLLRRGGLLLVCDAEPSEDAELLPRELCATRSEQEQAMLSAGFADFHCHLFKNQHYLVSATKP